MYCTCVLCCATNGRACVPSNTPSRVSIAPCTCVQWHFHVCCLFSSLPWLDTYILRWWWGVSYFERRPPRLPTLGTICNTQVVSSLPPIKICEDDTRARAWKLVGIGGGGGTGGWFGRRRLVHNRSILCHQHSAPRHQCSTVQSFRRRLSSPVRLVYSPCTLVSEQASL